jgi:hypothetical protein
MVWTAVPQRLNRGDDEYESEDKSCRKRERKEKRDTWDSTLNT